MLDGLKVACTGTHCGGCYFEAGKFHCSSAKLKFLWVEDNAIVAANVQPFDSLEERLFNIISPHEGVVYALGLLGKVCDYFIKATTVPVSGGDVSLGCNEVALTAPWSDESSQVFVPVVKGNAMISIPSVKDRFSCVGWHLAGLVEGRLCVVCFPCGVLIHGL